MPKRLGLRVSSGFLIAPLSAVFHLAPQVRLYYMNKDKWRLYAFVGAGVRVYNYAETFEGDTITGYVDGKQVVQAKSDRYPKGMVGLMAPMQQHRICTPYFDNLRIVPLDK